MEDAKRKRKAPGGIRSQLKKKQEVETNTDWGISLVIPRAMM